jgi:RNA polymerase sigma factor (sigma-70 family)
MRFEEFAATRLPAVLRFAGVLTADRALAEDVVQEVLIRASKRWDQLDRLDHPELYVRKMIVNEYLSWRRRSWRLLPKGSADEVDDRVTPDHAGLYAERDALLAELSKLPRRQRSLLPGSLRPRDRGCPRLHAWHRPRLRFPGPRRPSHRAEPRSSRRHRGGTKE